MKNADMPAMPLPLGSETVVGQQGLTKREMFAMAAMQGVLASLTDDCDMSPSELAICADALLKELDK